MPTSKTKRRAQVSKGKPRRKKAATASSNGKAAGSHDDPNQTFIEGTEPERIPQLDDKVARFTSLRKSMKTSKESADDELGKIKSLMEENSLEFYKTPFGDVTIQHGVTVVKVKLPKDR